VKKLLLLVAAAALMSACSESPTAPSAPRAAPSKGASSDIECLTGYVIAYDEFGNPYCAPASVNDAAARRKLPPG
jgi:hypothetical protein